ncbi:hypothetical protein D3C73_1444210 [compost metagenome]
MIGNPMAMARQVNLSRSLSLATSNVRIRYAPKELTDHKPQQPTAPPVAGNQIHRVQCTPRGDTLHPGESLE